MTEWTQSWEFYKESRLAFGLRLADELRIQLKRPSGPAREFNPNRYAVSTVMSLAEKHGRDGSTLPLSPPGDLPG